MPAGAVDDQGSVGAGRDAAADFLKMQVHRLGVDLRQHQGGADGAFRTDRAEEIDPLIASVAWGSAAAAILILIDARFSS